MKRVKSRFNPEKWLGSMSDFVSLLGYDIKTEELLNFHYRSSDA